MQISKTSQNWFSFLFPISLCASAIVYVEVIIVNVCVCVWVRFVFGFWQYWPRGEILKQAMQIIWMKNQVGMKMVYRRKYNNRFDIEILPKMIHFYSIWFYSHINFMFHVHFYSYYFVQMYFQFFFYISFSFLPDFPSILSASPASVTHPCNMDMRLRFGMMLFQ